MNDTTSPTETSADPLAATWYAQPNDVIGGWCVMDVDATPADAQRPEIADFTRREHAEHIADLHNERLARGHWHHAPDGSPYTRLKAYGDGGDTPPSREDVMELLYSYNAANAMNGVHKRTIARLRKRLDQAQAAPACTAEASDHTCTCLTEPQPEGQSVVALAGTEAAR